MPQPANILPYVLDERSQPFIVAEMSGNHNGSLERALAIVDAVADSGAHAIKLQTYTADTMTLNRTGGNFTINDPTSLWHGQSLYELYAKAHTPWEWHATIFARARQRGLVAFSTPFDESAISFLESLDVPCYKIASFENTDLPLIRRAASTKKPLIISAGTATEAELREAVAEARKYGCRELIVLKCTSAYPAKITDANLATLADIRSKFDVLAGISDHTEGTQVAVASAALGAVMIEKHVTLSRAEGGVDAAFSLEPHELRALVQDTKAAWQAVGTVQYGTCADEKTSLQFRRAVYVVRDVKKGERFTASNLRALRPGGGLPPKFLDTAFEKSATRDLTAGTLLTADMVTLDGES